MGMGEAAGHSPEVEDGAAPTAPVPSTDGERILLLECRLEQLRSALDEARANADRVRATLAAASAREADHARRHGLVHQELAEARAEIATLHERLGRSEAVRAELEGHLFEAGARGDVAELVRLRQEVLSHRERFLNSERTLARVRARMDELLLSREALLTRVAEWQRLVRKEGPEAVDLAEFISELRRDILHLEHRNAAGERQEAALRQRLVRAGLDPDASPDEDRSDAPVGVAAGVPPGAPEEAAPARLDLPPEPGEPEAEEPAEAEPSSTEGGNDGAGPYETASSAANPETADLFEATRSATAGDHAATAGDDASTVGDDAATVGDDADTAGDAAVEGSLEPAAPVSAGEGVPADPVEPEHPDAEEEVEADSEPTGDAEPPAQVLEAAAEQAGAVPEEPREHAGPLPEEPEASTEQPAPPPEELEEPTNTGEPPPRESEEPEDTAEPRPRHPEEPIGTAEPDPIEGLGSTDPAVRAAAYEWMARLLHDDPSRLVAHLRSGLEDPDPRVRRRAVLAAATARHLDLHPLLDPLRSDPDPQVRRVVRQVLRHAPPSRSPADDGEGAFAPAARGESSETMS